MTRSEEFCNPKSVTDKPYTVKIKKVVQNTQKIKSFFFDFAPNGYRVNILPGQFLMIWIPGFDEIPMSIAYIGPNEELGITVQNVGEATSKLHSLQKGDYLGVRGPYGNAYLYTHDFSVIIGGGVGLASLRELILGVYKHSIDKPVVIIGAKTEKELLYMDEFRKIGPNFQFDVCTDDGSCGYAGFVTQYFEEHVLDFIKMAKGNDKITVYTCGPEVMMYKIFEICEKHGIKMQASLERMMRCGFGLCGLCILDPIGVKVCQDGPVFDSEILRKTIDFGKFKRDVTGHKIPQ
jgi:dihydroorotate dehydrogenase electron transfer subunit